MNIFSLDLISDKVMGTTDIDDFEEVTFERSAQHGVSIQAGTFPYLVRRSLQDFGEL